MSPEDIADALVPAPRSFLAELAAPDRVEAIRPGRRRTFQAHESIWHHGDVSDHVLYVLHGWVKVTASSERGHEVLLAIRGPGDILGDLAALDGRPRGATATTLTAVHAVMVPARAFLATLHERPSSMLVLLRHLARRLRDSDQQRLHAVAHSTAERLAALLLDLAARHGVPGDDGRTIIDMPLSQREIAASLGTSRETVAKSLRLFRDRAIVTTSRKRIVIANPPALSALARSVQIDTDGV